jgi:hypothetical protein
MQSNLKHMVSLAQQNSRSQKQNMGVLVKDYRQESWLTNIPLYALGTGFLCG